MAEPSPAASVHPGWRRRGAPPPAARPRAAPRRPRAAPRQPRRCRVEHRRAGAAAVLARGLLAVPHHAELVPFASRLRLDGGAGEVVLVDEATGADLARRAVPGGAGRPRAANAGRFRPR